jgi:hypothetical protein
MKKRKYSQLKRNPFVRFIRWVLRFFKPLFKSNKGISRSSQDHSHFDPLTSITVTNNYNENNLLTVGELFEQVKWQFPQTTVTEPVLASSTHFLDDISLN